MNILWSKCSSWKIFHVIHFCKFSSIKKEKRKLSIWQRILTQFTLKSSIFSIVSKFPFHPFFSIHTFEFSCFISVYVLRIHKYKWFNSKSRNKCKFFHLFLIYKIQDWLWNTWEICITYSIPDQCSNTHI